MTAPSERQMCTVDAAWDIVEKIYQVSRAQVSDGSNKQTEVVLARRAVTFVLRKDLGLTWDVIVRLVVGEIDSEVLQYGYKLCMTESSGRERRRINEFRRVLLDRTK